MTFIENYEVLKKSIPVPAVWIDTVTKDADYIDYTYRSKGSYYAFGGYYLEDCLYTEFCGWGNKLVDSHSVTKAEKCYFCINCDQCHNCSYLMDCNSCTDCHFSAFLSSCNDCFGCVALTHKKYCIFNKQYTKQEYFKKVKELKKEEPDNIFALMFELKEKIPHPASRQVDNVNCPYGNYIYNSKNCYWSFGTFESTNSGYTYYCSRLKNCWDVFSSGGEQGTAKCYSIVSTQNSVDSAFLDFCEGCSNCYYSLSLINCTDCFGCVGLKNKKYCILNNQLTKEKYERAMKSIIKELEWKF